ncbi:MAG: V4R domain-containing protein [Nitrososphaerota archaeon]
MSKRFIPKEIFSGAYSPNRKIVEFSFKLKNVPGVIEKISSEMAKHRINILSGFHVAYPDKEEAIWSFFADFTNADIETKDIIEKIRSMNTILDMNFNEGRINGLLIDNFHFPLLVLNERSITLRVDSMASIIKRLYEVFGTGGATILYEMGMELGENAVKKTKEKYNIKGIEVLKAILIERITKGWGIPELEEFNEEKSISRIRVYELFECMPFKGMKKEASSYFFKGYLTGILKNLFNKEIEIIEEKCVAKGDPYCLFITK